MPVPVSVRPVRARMVLSLRISSQDASEVGSSEVWLLPAPRENPVGTESDTTSAPPNLTKPRRVMVKANGVIDVLGKSPDVSGFGVMGSLRSGRAWPRRLVAQHR